jgi:hypothetical protein
VEGPSYDMAGSRVVRKQQAESTIIPVKTPYKNIPYKNSRDIFLPLRVIWEIC